MGRNLGRAERKEFWEKQKWSKSEGGSGIISQCCGDEDFSVLSRASELARAVLGWRRALGRRCPLESSGESLGLISQTESCNSNDSSMLWSWQAVGLGFKPKSVQLPSPGAVHFTPRQLAQERLRVTLTLALLQVGHSLFQHWDSRSQLTAYGDKCLTPFYSKICFRNVSLWSGGDLLLWHC